MADTEPAADELVRRALVLASVLHAVMALDETAQAAAVAVELMRADDPAGFAGWLDPGPDLAERLRSAASDLLLDVMNHVNNPGGTHDGH